MHVYITTVSMRKMYSILREMGIRISLKRFLAGICLAAVVVYCSVTYQQNLSCMIINQEPIERVYMDMKHPTPAIVEDKNTVPICTKRERLKLLEEKCSNSSNMTAILALSDVEQMKFFRNFFMDTKHKILACLPPKSGCTTWKTILANNSLETPLPGNFNTMGLHFGHQLEDKFGIVKLSTCNTSFQQSVLNSDEYFKFMVARQPL